MLKSGANSTHPQAAVPYGNKADPYSAALRSSAAQNAGGKGNAANQNHAGDKNNTGAPKKKVGDVLFDTIQSWHSRKLGRKEFGTILDAGTGSKSLTWLQSLNGKGIDAVTADQFMINSVKKKPGARNCDRLLCGDWTDGNLEKLLKPEGYDTIIADYLIGAVDGFAPYSQDVVLEKLMKNLKHEGVLYIIGMTPVEDVPREQSDQYRTGRSLVSEVRRTRDAAILLAGQRPYREYPLDWLIRHLERLGFCVIKAQKFPITYTSTFIHRQISVGESKLQHIHPAMSQGLATRLRELKSMTNDLPAFSFGSDYVVQAVRKEYYEAALAARNTLAANMKNAPKSDFHPPSSAPPPPKKNPNGILKNSNNNSPASNDQNKPKTVFDKSSMIQGSWAANLDTTAGSTAQGVLNLGHNQHSLPTNTVGSTPGASVQGTTDNLLSGLSNSLQGLSNSLQGISLQSNNSVASKIGFSQADKLASGGFIPVNANVVLHTQEGVPERTPDSSRRSSTTKKVGFDENLTCGLAEKENAKKYGKEKALPRIVSGSLQEIIDSKKKEDSKEEEKEKSDKTNRKNESVATTIRPLGEAAETSSTEKKSSKDDKKSSEKPSTAALIAKEKQLLATCVSKGDSINSSAFNSAHGGSCGSLTLPSKMTEPTATTSKGNNSASNNTKKTPGQKLISKLEESLDVALLTSNNDDSAEIDTSNSALNMKTSPQSAEKTKKATTKMNTPESTNKVNGLDNSTDSIPDSMFKSISGEMRGDQLQQFSGEEAIIKSSDVVEKERLASQLLKKEKKEAQKNAGSAGFQEDLAKKLQGLQSM